MTRTRSLPGGGIPGTETSTLPENSKGNEHSRRRPKTEQAPTIAGACGGALGGT